LANLDASFSKIQAFKSAKKFGANLRVDSKRFLLSLTLKFDSRRLHQSKAFPNYPQIALAILKREARKARNFARFRQQRSSSAGYAEDERVGSARRESSPHGSTRASWKGRWPSGPPRQRASSKAGVRAEVLR
jgi:hypothetical protein